MFCVPEFYPNLSLRLTSVLEEIGVNERMILKWRRTWMLKKTLHNIKWRLKGAYCSHNFFGSQTEGTTTPGLHSDIDVLLCNHNFSVIQEWREWEPGDINMLKIQEETTPPGYCMLQLLHSDNPDFFRVMHDEHVVRYKGDKALLKNTFENQFYLNHVKNGSAQTEQRDGFCDNDTVSACPFKTLPEFLVTWLRQQTQQGKISQDMKTYIESNPCYVVPVGRRDSYFEKAEWRISTSHAERCLMFNLNITQLQCYILLKLLLKTHLKHPQEKALSSFMCKNILLLCIRQTHASKWIPQNLLSVFTFVLLQLKRSILKGNCPHFIMHESNLMAQKFTPQVKSWLLEKIQFIYKTNGCAFLEIEIDGIGNRLQTHINTPRRHNIFVRVIQKNQNKNISGALLYDIARDVSLQHKDLLQTITSGRNTITCIINTLVQFSHQGNYLEQAASCLLTPLFCSVGSVIASRDLHQGHSVSLEALTWLSLGLNSDVASGRLKMASVYYCNGDFKCTEHILKSTDESYDQNIVENVCKCYDQGRFSHSSRFDDYAYTHGEQSIRHITAFCVRFLPDEVHCQPRELQYEMFKSTQEDRAHRDEHFNFWMDWAVVDSLPYLYFLQYKAYGHLQRHDQQQQALNNLVTSIHITRNLLHAETDLNLLGQCYQQENRHTEALQCYVDSLNVRPTNNAARLHICLLLYAIYTSRLQ